MTTPPRFASDDLYDARIAQKEQSELRQWRLVVIAYPCLILLSCAMGVSHARHPFPGSPIEKILYQALFFGPPVFLSVSWLDALEKRRKNLGNATEPMVLVSSMVNFLMDPTAKAMLTMRQHHQSAELIALSIFASAILLLNLVTLLRQWRRHFMNYRSRRQEKRDPRIIVIQPDDTNAYP
ncbi:MAG: hypothetical protein JWQ02_1717 [Capsulimonas sp.]|nr:hypothetical protein [Capsulimonas sp.]